MIDLEHAAYRMCEQNDPIEHARLQKTLFIAQMFYAGLNQGERLICTNFYAWKYGPICAELYYQLQRYERRRIPYKKVWPHVNLENADPEDIEFLDFISGMVKESKKTIHDLMGYCSAQESAWDRVRRPGNHNIVIPQAEMELDYNERYPEINGYEPHARAS